MKSLTDTYTLHNGVKIPVVGFGTWQTPNDDTGYNAVLSALEAGYRHIDTAAIYGNEEAVGRAIRNSGIRREDIFLTSKVWNDDHGYEATLKAFDMSLDRLSSDYLDLYLIHWPNPIRFRNTWKESNAGTWKAMEELYGSGKIKAIGISNFLPHHIDALLETAKVIPMVNQIRLCPGDTKKETVDYCRKYNMILEAYSPLGTGKVFDVQELKDLSVRYDTTVAKLCLRWSLQKGFLPLPKSVNPERIKDNADIFGFVISDEDMKFISNLEGCCGLSSDPDKTGY